MTGAAILSSSPPRAEPRDRADGRLYRAGWIAAGLAMAAAVAVLLASGMRLALETLLPVAAAPVLLVPVHRHYRRSGRDPVLAAASGAVALLVLAGLAGGIVAHAGLRLRRPLVDARLAAADRWLGIDTGAIAAAVGRRPGWAALLDLAYASAVPMVFVAALWLAVRGREERLAELCLGFAGTLLPAALAGTAYPALGSLAARHAPAIAGLPADAGTFHLAAIAWFRDAADPRFDVAMMSGVVTFPSFHMVMALLVPFAFRDARALRWPALAWGLLVAASAIPIGGHYAVDLIGGALLWAGLMLAVGRSPAPRTPRHVAALADMYDCRHLE